MPPKRACDSCISRKVKCNGSWPCSTCRDGVKRVACTYLKPPRKRGPKARRIPHQARDLEDQRVRVDVLNEEHDECQRTTKDGLTSWPLTELQAPPRISQEVLAPIVHLYQQYSYSVWPVVNADVLLDRLQDVDPANTGHDAKASSCLVTALCAATMAQLHLAPVMDGTNMIDSTTMAHACLYIRDQCKSQREQLSMNCLLISFFLHVYHAKVNKRTSAMMFIQEAINGARVLRLDKPVDNRGEYGGGNEFIANQELVFPLLWVSER